MDQVKTCSTNQVIAEYVYDYNGNRMVKRNFTNGIQANAVISWSDAFETTVATSGAQLSSNSYYFVNNELVAKKNNDGSMNYIHGDHLGSTSLTTNQSGSLVENTTYNPWGKIGVGGTSSKFLYTGQEHDSETGLEYYNARYYSTDIRRFTQPDTFTSNIYNPQDLNEYSYVLNNPLRYTDPTGHSQVDEGLDPGIPYFGDISHDFEWGHYWNAADKYSNIMPGVDVEKLAVVGALKIPGVDSGLSMVSKQVIKQSGKILESRVGKQVLQKAADAKQFVSSGNNIIRINSQRIAVGPALKSYEKAKVQNKFVLPFHLEFRKDAGFIELYNKSIYNADLKKNVPKVITFWGKYIPYKK